MQVVVAYENTPLGAKLKLKSVIRAQIWPNRTSKHPKKGIVGCFPLEANYRSIKIYDFGRDLVYKKNDSKECFVPELKRHRGLR
jgi:hypothetical protein